MSVDLMTSIFAQEQFGEDAAKVTRGVVRAILAAHQTALDTQEASGLEAKFPYGSVWSAKFANLVTELSDVVGAEIIKVRKTSYCLVKLRGKLLVPFRHATTLTVPITQAKIGSDVLRSVTGLSVPRPPRPLDLFDSIDDTGSGSHEQASETHESAVLDPDTTVIYIGFVANPESPSVLGAWWGVGEAQAADGALTWSPEKLPLDIVSPGEVVARVPQQRAGSHVPAFDEGPVPPADLGIRPRLTDAPVIDDERQDGSAAADERE